jgi:hypothetical protein
MQNDTAGEFGFPTRFARTREDGVRNTRRASNLAAAALIAGVAVTTGYLAHSIPTTGAGTTSSTVSHGKAIAGAHGSPVVGGPVVTSGGSGAVAGSGGAAGGWDN